ncbi:hypothetical protein H6P81_007899 [Aristolochia fimbriata]|uniref:Glutaredoxin domain-containing protein n=1 Tax=Aristolochia fimbriata TaxID=158543 RepID=A0AAV7F1I1_ARIFI|nr:hypothetical protein H6P81_007899 [Aristolochia fimbriata]
MGCASSKRVEATVAADIYRPPPASFAVFNITAIDEPWLDSLRSEEKPDKPARFPVPILQKLDKLDQAADDAPHSWSEVSKALEDLKPALHQALTKPSPEIDTTSATPPGKDTTDVIPKETTEKSLTKNRSYHTLEELEAKLSNKPTQVDPQPEPEPPRAAAAAPSPDIARFNSLKNNIFIVRDRLERQKNADGSNTKPGGWNRPRDPLIGFPEKCPPGGGASVVLYTTTLRGVRRTFEDCQRARQVIDAHRAEVDERDVALHGQYLGELRELLGDEDDATVPRLFVKGRYVGGVEQVVELNESGRLRRILDSVGGGSGQGRRDCDGCGGLRFVLCFDCNGSCKVLSEDKKGTLRCTKCNENGLVYCPLCH